MTIAGVRLGAARALRRLGLVVLGATLLGGAAQAQPERPSSAPGWRGDIGRFHEHDWRLWRSGRWVHGRHAGRIGWWWVVARVWYSYPAPVYPYPNPWEPSRPHPPGDDAPPVPPTAYWYFCEASKSHYPYVALCPGGWRQVPAVPIGVPPVPAKWTHVDERCRPCRT